MPRIDHLIEERIKATADIVTIVGEFCELRPSTGGRMTCLCPFHADRHLGSVSIRPKQNTFTCFACGMTLDPIEFVRRHENMDYPSALLWLAGKYGIPVGGEVVGAPTFTPRPKPEPLPAMRFPLDYVNARRDGTGNVLLAWMQSLPWDNVQRARVAKVWNDYAVGTARQGHSIFWQIDDVGEVHTAKMMLYRRDGHRDKDTRGNFHWVHTLMAAAGKINLERSELQQCLFGLHLLRLHPSAVVNIVESEKTALLAAIYFGNSEQHIWMACGGLMHISDRLLSPVIKAGRWINLIPDRDGVEEWKKRARLIKYDRLRVVDHYVRDVWKEEDGQKADLGDIIVRVLHDREVYAQTKPQPVHVSTPLDIAFDKIKNKYPVAAMLADSLELEPLQIKTFGQ